MEKHRYRIDPVVRRSSTSKGHQGEQQKSERKESEVLKTGVDAYLEKMRGITVEKAKAFAAQAVTEAEVAIAAAEAAEREAVEAEAEAAKAVEAEAKLRISLCRQVTAEVVYYRRSDAQKAIESYNNSQLRGRPMKIKIMDANVTTPVDLPRRVAGSTRKPGSASSFGQGRGGVTWIRKGIRTRSKKIPR